MLSLSSLDKSVREDLKVLRDSPLVRPELKEHLHGYVLDIKTGLLRQVKE